MSGTALKIEGGRRAAARRSSGWADPLFKGATAAAAGSILLLLGAIAYQLVGAASESIGTFGLSFITSNDWDPVSGGFGALPFVFGTVATSLLALLIALPMALGSAIFLSELSPAWLREPLGFLVELLAAIPSVAYGLWGIFVLAPWLRDTVQPPLAEHLGHLPLLSHLFGGTPRGFGMMAGGIILAIMILPTIASVSRDVMRAVPNTWREGALALGATRWETVTSAVLPGARAGILGAIVLGLGRALGETMAVTMVIGNRAELSASLFAPGATLASAIANEYAEAVDTLHLSALSELGLLLLGVTLCFNLAARFLLNKVGRSARTGATL